MWRDDISKTYLQHLHKHINDVSDGIIRPEAEGIHHICSDFRENTKNDIFKLKLHNHGKSMISAQQAVLSSCDCPENFQMGLSFISNDDDTDDDIKSISGTGSSREWILSMDVSQGQNREIKLSNAAVKVKKHSQCSCSFFSTSRYNITKSAWWGVVSNPEHETESERPKYKSCIAKYFV